MTGNEFFPLRPNATPTIYAYADTHPQYAGLLKIGFTNADAKTRVAQQYPIIKPGALPYVIVLEESAMRNDGSSFSDHDVHRYLRNRKIKNPDGEWFECTVKEVLAAILAIKTSEKNEDNRTLDFKMRPEQKAAVEQTSLYFKNFQKESDDKPPRFLWNAKMRFGKTFTAYQLAKAMGWKKILVLTFKPAVQSAWEEDLKTHIDFVGWQFIARNGDLKIEQADRNKPIVCFGSFQDYLGTNKTNGGIKNQNEWVHAMHWDCVIIDEYHYGAWRESAKELIESEDKNEYEYAMGEGIEKLDEGNIPITTDAYLYLSGTPFRAISAGEFLEENIFNWTYSDEQRAKENWLGENNPYESLPRIVLMTYQLPEIVRKIANQGEFNEFDLNVFFSAEGTGDTAKFIYENEVQKWLDFIRGALTETLIDDLKLGKDKAYLPFAFTRLLNVLSHTFWFMKDVASCYAMKNLLSQKQNKFYQDYEIIVAAGIKAGVGMKALPPVYKAMDNPLKTKSITLSCGKLTTGVSVKPWTGIFMLRSIESPETYFQAAFRVQTPWTIKNPDSKSPNKEEIIKKECYIFDFAPDRALRQIEDYCNRLDMNEQDTEKKVGDFIRFLPVLSYEGGSMDQLNAGDILDKAISGTNATQLAKRWASPQLVNVDNDTLARLMKNPAAIAALMNVEGFRALKEDIEIIIAKSDAVKKTKKEAHERELDEKEKKELTEDEKEFKKKRTLIQENLQRLVSRIPIFLYLTDFRERSLKDVITQLEPGLFKKVTALTVQDFELLVSLGLFNSQLMNEAIGGFKRYEDASLKYINIYKHEDMPLGLFDTVLSHDDLK